MAAELVIEGGPRPHLAQSVRELWLYRATVLAFAERDVRVKYKQAVLGVAWAVVQPLLFMAVFVVALGRVAHVSGGGSSYAAFALSALVPWTFVQTAVSFGAGALLTDASLVRKVYFPREAPVLGAILASDVDLAIGIVLFVVLGPVFGSRPSPVWLLTPLLGLVAMILATGVALIFAALNVYYRDFRYVVPFALQLWLFASPVAYPLSIVPHRWRLLYIGLNPAVGVLDGFRRVLARGQLPDAPLLLTSAATSLALVWIGYRAFKSLERNFADVI